MQIQKRKEAKRAEFKGEVSQYREQRCFHFYWNHLSLQFGWGWCSHLPHWVLRMKSATSESSCFCYTPVKTEAPRSCHSSGAPCYVSSFRTHHEAHVELCQEAPRTSSREEDGRRPWLTAQVRSYTEALKFKPVYLMKDVSKQESKQEALDDYCLVWKMPWGLSHLQPSSVKIVVPQMTSMQMKMWKLLCENVDLFVQAICSVVGLGTVFLESS